MFLAIPITNTRVEILHNKEQIKNSYNSTGEKKPKIQEKNGSGEKWARKLKSYFITKAIQVANKPVKTFLMLLEMQIKSIMRFNYTPTPTQWLKIKRLRILIVGEDREHTPCQWSVN